MKRPEKAFVEPSLLQGFVLSKSCLSDKSGQRKPNLAWGGGSEITITVQ